MLKHYPKLKKLCINSKGNIDGRKMNSKAFAVEMIKTIVKMARKTPKNLDIDFLLKHVKD